VHPAVNWYFMIGSTFLITFVGWFVTRSSSRASARTTSRRPSEDLDERGPDGARDGLEKKELVGAALGATAC
jgi:p-aminobenzoyl-glutamate transporter AbgT